MTKNEKTKKSSQGVKITKEKSSLAEFIERPVPTAEEAEEFDNMISGKKTSVEEGGVVADIEDEADEAIEKELEDEVDDDEEDLSENKNEDDYEEEDDDYDEVSDEEIDESLSEIYQDDQGEMVDVIKLEIKKRRGFAYWILSFVFVLAIIAGTVYGVYYYLLNSGSDASSVELKLEGPDSADVGEEIFYTITYNNLTGVTINNARLEVTYPDNFIFLDSSLIADIGSGSLNSAGVGNGKKRSSIWKLGKLADRKTGQIKIKGQIIDKKDASGIFFASLSYNPENFSSEFTKESSFTTKIGDVGLDFEYDYSKTVLVGEQQSADIQIIREDGNFIDKFRMSIGVKEGVKFSLTPLSDKEADVPDIGIKEIKLNTWEISKFLDMDKLKLSYVFEDKISNEDSIDFTYEYLDKEGNVFVFNTDKLDLEVMKSDLNLSLILNGSSNDNSVNFGDILNYSISYNNKGESSMTDVVIMVVLESEFVDWTSLSDQNSGREKGNTITWSKKEVPGLEIVGQEEEGVIDFSVRVSNFRESDIGKVFQIKSYAQYNIGNKDDFDANADRKSNTIVSKINSDLDLGEQIRYFSVDNIPVGTGPLPPKVGEETTFKVYWTISNNLHELRDAKAEVKLPSYVVWKEKNRTSVGTIKYDESTHSVSWQIGRLPVSVYRADAEFGIGITPTEDDKDKILILLPGSEIEAVDNETGARLSEKTTAKTTKLEDDDVAALGNDGRVQ